MCVLLVGVALDINAVVSHGLVGQLVQDGADGVKPSLHDQQLGLSLSLEMRGGGNTNITMHFFLSQQLTLFLV